MASDAAPRKLPDGRWRLRLDIGTKIADGKPVRDQIMRTFSTKAAALAWKTEVLGRIAAGKPAREWDGTFDELARLWLASNGVQSREANTRQAYRLGLEAARERLGGMKAKAITRRDVEAFLAWLITEGRRRGGKPGTGLSMTSVAYSLKRIRAAYEWGIEGEMLLSNPAAHAKLPPQPDAAFVPDDDEDDGPARYTAPELRQFLLAASQDRLYACWLLSAYGMRRGEVAGLRWSRVDLDARKITIPSRNATRVMVAGQGDDGIVTKGPKSANGVRKLPLDDTLVAALRSLRDLQELEAIDFGRTFREDCYLLADEAGQPVRPDRYSRMFLALAAKAGLPRLRLHNMRHTATSVMADLGVPDHIRAKWLGHTVAMARTTYTLADEDGLAAARDALSQAMGGAP